MIRRVLRAIYRLLAVVVSLMAIAANLRLYHPSTPGTVEAVAETKEQLAFIRASLDSGGGGAMQELFPEGYFFTHAQYGLTWVDLATTPSADPALQADALREATWALSALESPQGSAPFPLGLDPPYGVFYNGWTAWLQGGILRLEPSEERDPGEVESYERRCDSLAAAFEASPTPFLMAYSGQAWPVDSVVAVAALSQHDQFLPSRYASVIARWEELAQSRLDPATGLLPHRVDPDTGALLEGARGSSQSMINRFLPAIDPSFAADQYLRFRKQFVAIPLGFREYSAGNPGLGDVDSGPLVLGISASSTIVSIGAARANGDEPLAGALSGGAEMVGLPLEWGGRKFYGLGLLPVGDAMLAWSRAATPYDPPPAPPNVVPGLWRWPFHLLSLIGLVVLWCPEWIGVLRRRRPGQVSP